MAAAGFKYLEPVFAEAGHGFMSCNSSDDGPFPIPNSCVCVGGQPPGLGSDGLLQPRND